MSQPVTVPAIPTRQVRMTIVQVRIPFWRRLFARELILGVLGTVQDVALLTRSQGQEMLAQGYQSKWLPYEHHPATEPQPGPPPEVKRA